MHNLCMYVALLPKQNLMTRLLVVDYYVCVYVALPTALKSI